MSANPILDDLVRVVRDETSIDIAIETSMDGGYHVRAANTMSGPLDHRAAWHYLVGILAGAGLPKSLKTRKSRSRAAIAAAADEAAKKTRQTELKNRLIEFAIWQGYSAVMAELYVSSFLQGKDMTDEASSD